MKDAKMLENTHDLDNAPDNRPPLVRAAMAGDVALVKSLISKGANVNAKYKGSTLLHGVAAWHDTPEMAQFLVAKGADVNAKNKDGETPLHLATLCNRTVEFVKCFVKGANINVKNKDGNTPLHLAMPTGDVEVDEDVDIVKYLVSKGADLYAKNKKGDTPLSMSEGIVVKTELAKILVSTASKTNKPKKPAIKKSARKK